MAASNIALRIAAFLVSRLPHRAMASLGALLGFLAGSILRIRRAHVDEAIARAEVPSDRAARRMYTGLGGGIMDLLWLAGVSASRREAALANESIGADTEQILDDAVAAGPVVLFASHTGNWEIVASAAARHFAKQKRHLAVVAKAVSAKGVDAFMMRLRSVLGVDTIAPQGAFVAARRMLGQGDVIAMPIDQVPDRSAHGTRMMFLGCEALVDRAPATLAWRARATVIVVVAASHKSSHVRVLDVIAPPRPQDESRAWIDATTKHATKLLEGFIHENPSAWMWLHRRWREPRDQDHLSGAKRRSPDARNIDGMISSTR